MKNVITLGQFVDLIKNAPIEETFEWDDEEMKSGVISNTLKAPGFEITYSKIFECPAYKPERAYLLCDNFQNGDLTWYVERVCDNFQNGDLTWDVERERIFDVIMTNDEGETIILDDNDLTEIADYNTLICCFSLGILGENPLENFDYDANQPDKKIIVERDNMKNLCFTGDLLAQVSDYDYIDNDITWHDLELYRTISGNYVCVIIRKTNMVYDDIREDIQKRVAPVYRVCVKNSPEKAKELFLKVGEAIGNKNLAAELLNEAGI